MNVGEIDQQIERVADVVSKCVFKIVNIGSCSRLYRFLSLIAIDDGSKVDSVKIE